MEEDSIIIVSGSSSDENEYEFSFFCNNLNLAQYNNSDANTNNNGLDDGDRFDDRETESTSSNCRNMCNYKSKGNKINVKSKNKNLRLKRHTINNKKKSTGNDSCSSGRSSVNDESCKSETEMENLKSNKFLTIKSDHSNNQDINEKLKFISKKELDLIGLEKEEIESSTNKRDSFDTEDYNDDTRRALLLSLQPQYMPENADTLINRIDETENLKYRCSVDGDSEFIMTSSSVKGKPDYSSLKLEDANNTSKSRHLSPSIKSSSREIKKSSKHPNRQSNNKKVCKLTSCIGLYKENLSKSHVKYSPCTFGSSSSFDKCENVIKKCDISTLKPENKSNTHKRRKHRHPSVKVQNDHEGHKASCSHSNGYSWSRIKAEKVHSGNSGSLLKPLILDSDCASEEEFSDDLPDIDIADVSNIKVEKADTLLQSSLLDYDSLDDFEIPSKKFKSSQPSPKQFNYAVKAPCKPNIKNSREDRSKLANLIKFTVLEKDLLIKTKQTSPSVSSVSNSRHWMDCLDSLNSSSKLPNESDYSDDSLSSDYFGQYATDNNHDNSHGVSRHIRCENDNSLESVTSCTKCLPKNKKIKLEHNWTENASTVNLEEESGPVVKLRTVHATLPISKEITSVPWQPNKAQYHSSINQIQFPVSYFESSLVESFSVMHIYSLEAAMEEGDEFFEYSLNVLKSFMHRKPTLKIVNDILFKGLIGNYNANICVKSYNMLRFVWQRFPDLIQIDWELLCNKMDITHQMNSSAATNIQSGLLLHLYVFGIEVNLVQNGLKNRDKLLKTFACKLLDVGCSFKNLNLIITWIKFSLNSATFEEESGEMLYQNLHNQEITEKQLLNFNAPYKLLPDLSRLLELGIDISQSCLEAAKRISSELEKTYVYLSDIKQKKMLLQSIHSDLLVLKLVQRVMEDYCDGIVISSTDFPLSFNKLQESYFSAFPPKSPICTPPQSPSDQDHGYNSNTYSAVDVEELSVLVFYLVKSYLSCITRGLYEQLHLRLCGNQIRMSKNVKLELEHLPLHAERFLRHLQELCPDLNPATVQYCMLLTCLSESL